jgi:heterodisulfide reductase subunit A
MEERPFNRNRQLRSNVSGSSPTRVGVYVCHCGGNISDVVDVERVVQAAIQMPEVVVARHFSAMCSQGGQNLLIEDIQREKLDRIVVAAGSPSLHEHTFRAAVARADLNPYLYEHVNLREQVSWCTKSDPEGATDKAIRLVAAGVAKARKLQPLSAISMKAVHHVTVVGGGVSGLRAARDLSRVGLAVTLLERSPFLGGRVAQWHCLYPTDNLARDLLATLVEEVDNDPNITVYTQAEVAGASGCLGTFQLQVALKPRGVDHLSPAEIKAAIEACPIRVASEFDFGLTERKAIYRPYEGCSPSTPAIDWKACTR